MCVGVSGLGVGVIVLADTGIGDVELVAYGRRARAYVGNGAGGVRRIGVLQVWCLCAKERSLRVPQASASEVVSASSKQLPRPCEAREARG